MLRSALNHVPTRQFKDNSLVHCHLNNCKRRIPVALHKKNDPPNPHGPLVPFFVYCTCNWWATRYSERSIPDAKCRERDRAYHEICCCGKLQCWAAFAAGIMSCASLRLSVWPT